MSQEATIIEQSDCAQPCLSTPTPASEIVTMSGRKVNPPNPPPDTMFDIWSETELETLLDAISKHGQDDIETLQKCVITKTSKEIQDHLRKLKTLKTRFMRSVKAPKAPIEAWLNTISAVIGNDTDNSNILAKVLSIAGNLEPHDEITDSKNTPKFSNIYRFLASLMSDEEPTELSRIEAALVLELLQGLSDKLKSYDTSKQREMMMQKFEEIHSKNLDTTEDSSTDTGKSDNQSLNYIRNDQKAKNHEVSNKKQAPKRPALFSINPFAIPVKYLKLEKRNQTQ